MAKQNAIGLEFEAGGGNTYTFPVDTDTLVGRDSTDTLTNKTLTAPIFSGTITGTYTLGGTPTFPSTISLPGSPATITTSNGVASLLLSGGRGYLTIVGDGTGSSSEGLTLDASGGSDPYLYPTATNRNLVLKGSGTGKVRLDAAYGAITADTDGSTVTFNMATSNIHSVTLGGNRTLAVSNVSIGQVFMLKLKQDATGSRTVTWFSGISWAGGSAPTLTTTAGKTDWIGFVCTGSGTYDGCVVMANV